MIEIKNLVKTYGNVQALRGVSLEIDGPGIFGLLGVNGAGKTTMMRTVAGLLTPDSGSVRVFGNLLNTRVGRLATRTLLGYLPQDVGIYPNLTAREFLDYVAILKGITNKAHRQREIALQLERVRLLDVADRQIKGFSGGMKQRIAIAQALVGRPKLLIVDEPTAGLDPEERIRIRNLLGDLAQSTTVILSTHIVEDIGYSCSDLAVLFDGQIVFRGTPSSLIAGAAGRVWTILSRDGSKPNTGLVVVATRQTAEGVQYRVIGNPDSTYQATSAEPGLEDGYMWLMHRTRRATVM